MPAGQVDLIRRELEAVARLIPSVRSYRCGPDLGADATNYDFVVVATFDDLDGWREYEHHPEHDRVRTESIKPWVAERARAQFES